MTVLPPPLGEGIKSSIRERFRLANLKTKKYAKRRALLKVAIRRPV
jgi:hypothetical protein